MPKFRVQLTYEILVDASDMDESYAAARDRLLEAFKVASADTFEVETGSSLVS